MFDFIPVNAIFFTISNFFWRRFFIFFCCASSVLLINSFCFWLNFNISFLIFGLTFFLLDLSLHLLKLFLSFFPWNCSWLLESYHFRCIRTFPDIFSSSNWGSHLLFFDWFWFSVNCGLSVLGAWRWLFISGRRVLVNGHLRHFVLVWRIKFSVVVEESVFLVKITNISLDDALHSWSSLLLGPVECSALETFIVGWHALSLGHVARVGSTERLVSSVLPVGVWTSLFGDVWRAIVTLVGICQRIYGGAVVASCWHFLKIWI